MSIKEEIHGLSGEIIKNMGRLVAIDSQLGTPAEGMPFGEGPAKVLEEALKIADELGFKTVNLDNYCGYAEMGEGEEIVGIAGTPGCCTGRRRTGHMSHLRLQGMAIMYTGVEQQMIKDRL